MINRTSLPVVLASLLAAGCAPSVNYAPPEATPPPLGYVETEYSADQLWEAVLDFLADTGAQWQPWSSNARFVQGEVILALGPMIGQTETSGGTMHNPIQASVPRLEPNAEGPKYADCGSVVHPSFGTLGVGQADSIPLSGTGTLHAAVTVRVRERVGDQAGLLKVTVPKVWATGVWITVDQFWAGPVWCISNGAFEQEAIEAILDRATPTLIR